MASSGDEKENGAISCEDSSHHHCSFAVTGPQEAFQAIYICHSCSTKPDELLCVCRACADACHFTCEGLEYVGMGPSYCDCRQLKGGCKIEAVSEREAARLGIPWNGHQRVHVLGSASPKKEYVRDAFRIRSLDDASFCNVLILQAKELVRHSRETFWLDAGADESSFCELEQLASKIFQQNVKSYSLQGTDVVHGAEWWVQIKSVSVPEEGKSLLESHAKGSEAVDLHYDKDEVLAESFGLGAFPALSTVTYLTDSHKAPPTVVFSRRYDQGEDCTEVIEDMLISHPRRGKHLVFDGRLLHGAPSHHALRPLETSKEASEEVEQFRITFLVNLWMGQKPAGVQMLPKRIREAIKQATWPGEANSDVRGMDTTFDRCPVPKIELKDENDLPQPLRGRIELPFVGKGTTWETDEDDTTMVLVTFPPPDHEGDTLFVRFGPGLQAYLDYQDEEHTCGVDEQPKDAEAGVGAFV